MNARTCPRPRVASVRRFRCRAYSANNNANRCRRGDPRASKRLVIRDTMEKNARLGFTVTDPTPTARSIVAHRPASNVSADCRTGGCNAVACSLAAASIAIKFDEQMAKLMDQCVTMASVAHPRLSASSVVVRLA